MSKRTEKIYCRWPQWKSSGCSIDETTTTPNINYNKPIRYFTLSVLSVLFHAGCINMNRNRENITSFGYFEQFEIKKKRKPQNQNILLSDFVRLKTTTVLVSIYMNHSLYRIKCPFESYLLMFHKGRSSVSFVKGDNALKFFSLAFCQFKTKYPFMFSLVLCI